MPEAFRVGGLVQKGRLSMPVERAVRQAYRNSFRRAGMLARIVPQIKEILAAGELPEPPPRPKAAGPAFAEPITTGTGPYVHEFRSGGWDLTSFAVEIGLPDVPHHGLDEGCKAEAISLTMSRSGQPMTATVFVVGRAETIAAVSGAGTPIEWANRRFGHLHGTPTRNGAVLGALRDLVGVSLTCANDLDRIEAVGDGGRIAGADLAIAALAGSMKVRFASQACCSRPRVRRSRPQSLASGAASMRTPCAMRAPTAAGRLRWL